MDTITTLKVSPQGQITIPKAWRKALNIKPGVKMIAYLSDWVKSKVLTLQSEPKSWVSEVAGTGKGIWGSNSDKYLQKERDSWERK